MPPNEKSTRAYEAMNSKTFRSSMSVSSNAKRNAMFWKQMSLAERETGMTGEGLQQYQLSLKEAYLARRAGA